MLLYYLRLLYDPAAWEAWRNANPNVTPQSAWERAKIPLKAMLLGLGAGIISGQINLGPTAWWTAPVMILISALIQKQPNLVAVTAGMTDSQKAAMHANVAARAGAPDAVVAAPAAPPAV